MIFGWTIKWERLYFKSKRIEYRLRIYKPIKYKRTKHSAYTLAADQLMIKDLAEGIDTVNTATIDLGELK